MHMFVHTMYSICLVSLSPSTPPSVEGGDRAAVPCRPSSLFFCLPVSSKDPCIPEPEFGKCVCTDPPPPTCMDEGCPPYTQVAGGSLHTYAFPKFRNQEHKSTFSV